MSNIEHMIRARQVQDAALAEVNEKISACKEALHSFEELTDRVTTLPEKLSYDVMVEFGKHAFMPGKLVHTNELMVHLGDAYFASVTCQQALKIIKLRSTNLENTLTDLEKVAANITKKADYLGEMNQEAQKDLFEIREECPESYKHPKDRRRISRVKEPVAAETTPDIASARSHDSLLSRLDELQRLEDEEDHLDRESEHLDFQDTAIQQHTAEDPINHDDNSARSLPLDLTNSLVLKSHHSKKVHFADSDDETPTIRFKHSDVRPTLTEDMTPGDIEKLFQNPLTKTDKVERQPLPRVAAISDTIIERPMAAPQSKLQPTEATSISKFSGSKPVSKFKANRMKQWD